MSGRDIDNSEIAKWDPAFSELFTKVVGPIVKRWFQAEVRGEEQGTKST
jgi:hypothetical protein